MNDLRENVKSERQWLRGLFMLLFLIIYEIAEMILIVVTLGQFLFSIVTGNNNNNLRQFGDSLAQFVRQIATFLTYNSDEKPFPFSDWPKPLARMSDSEEDQAPPPTTGS